jgi:hypothetical protein
MSIPSARHAVNAGGAAASVDPSGRAIDPLIAPLPDRYVPPEVDDSAPLLDWVGELAGVWRLEELPELVDELDDELDELDELAPDELVPDELVPDELVGLLAVLSCDDVPESFTALCAAPGRTATSAPVTATLAKDTVMVVAFRRRLPCSRSATARAISRLFMSPSLTRTAEWTVRGKSENALSASTALDPEETVISTPQALLGATGLGSLPNGQ